ncbi:MAG: hypothetical protein ACOC70_02900, partial [bacterium]
VLRSVERWYRRRLGGWSGRRLAAHDGRDARHDSRQDAGGTLTPPRPADVASRCHNPPAAKYVIVFPNQSTS